MCSFFKIRNLHSFQESVFLRSFLIASFFLSLLMFRGECFVFSQAEVKENTAQSIGQQGTPLPIDDINQFSEKGEEIGGSDLELKEKANRNHEYSPALSEDGSSLGRSLTIVPFSGEKLCADEETLLASFKQTLHPYTHLLSRCSHVSDWSQKSEFCLEKALQLLEQSPSEARQFLLEIQRQLTRLDEVKQQMIQLGEIDPATWRDREDLQERSPSTKAHSSDSTKDKNGRWDGLIGFMDELNTYTREKKEKDGATFSSRTPAELPQFFSRYSLANRLEILDSFRFALERRIYFWSLASNYYEFRNLNRLIAPPELTLKELMVLREKTEGVRLFFGIDPSGREWRQNFEVDDLLHDLEGVIGGLSGSPVFEPVAGDSLSAGTGDSSPTRLAQEKLGFLLDRINSICYKVVTTPMTQEQQEIFLKEPCVSWVRLLNRYTCDQADPRDLLWAFEEYERTAGASMGETLSRLAYRMKSSHSEVCRRFGEGIEVIFDNPNAKVYISEILISRLLPVQDPEFDSVNEYVLNNPVAGRRRTDTQVAIELVPSPDRILLNLLVRGRIVASTSSSVYPATVFNQSYATYLGRKPLEWRRYGLVTSTAEVAVEMENELSGVQTEVDFLPVIGDLVRGMAKGQYELQQEEIRQASRRRIQGEVRHRIDEEADVRFAEMNERLKERFFGHLDRLGLQLRLQRSKTTEEWILASMRLESNRSLGSQSVEPPTLPGAFADLKVHESTINVFLSSLELEGKEMDLSQLLRHLGDRLQSEFFKNLNIAPEEEVYFQLAKIDPVTVRFFEDRVQIRLAFEWFELGDQSWENVSVIVSYRPLEGPDRSPHLTRDGLITLEGPMNIRAQVPLRAVFSKVFPEKKIFPLVPAIFKKDDRFTELSTGLCRISRGWFAISIVRPVKGDLYKYR